MVKNVFVYFDMWETKKCLLHKQNGKHFAFIFEMCEIKKKCLDVNPG